MKIPCQEPVARERVYINLKPEIVEAILQILSIGWQSVLKEGRVNADNHEVEITECLRKGMRGAVQKSSIKISVLRGTESLSRPSMLVPDGLIDIPLMLSGNPQLEQEQDPHVIIECKRITGANASLCRLYVTEGMDRFISRQYGWNHAQDFMVGYVLSSAPSDAVKKINAHLTRKSREEDRLKKSNIGATSTWQSKHARPRPLNPVILYHRFFTFDGAR